MARQKVSEGKFSRLKTGAEETLSGKPSDMEDISVLTPEEVQRLVHELRVHQVELEVQNEDLSRAQIELEELKDRYLDLYDFAPVGYVMLNEKGLILEANLTAVRLLGVERHSLMKKPFSRFVSQEFGDAFYLHLQQVFETQSKQTCEIKLEGKDGIHFYAQLDSVAVKDKSGRFNRCRTVIVDITERKLATKALHESEEQYRAVFDNAGVGIDLLDRDGRIVKVNQALLNILGYAEDELRQLTFLAITHPDDREISKRKLESLMAGEVRSYRLEKRYVTKDGGIIWGDLWSSTIRDENGEHVGTVAVIEDITQRKVAEEALQDSQDRYGELFARMSSGVAVFEAVDDGKDFIFKALNSAAEKIEHINQANIIGKRFTETFPGAKEFGILDIFQRVWRTGEQEYFPPHIYGDERDPGVWRESWVYKLSSGEIVELYNDITDRQNAQEERERLRIQLLQAQKMEAIGTLAGGIAHDFNNILTVVLGFADLLLAQKDDKDADYEDLRKILRAGQNGAELVRRLLMFSRKSEPKPTPINLNREVVQVEKLLRRSIPRMIDIQLELSADLPEINADSSQIEQVLINLAVNARDAMQQNGKLTLKTEAVTLDEEYCRLHVEATPGEYVLLEVSDTGQGMDKETLRQIFDPFFTTKEIGRGTGLGLAMVFGVVKQHAGHITCYSEVGKGTTFRVYFPAIEGEVETDVETTSIMPAFGTETVLLVDDEELVGNLGARILTKHGYTVLKAANGREALEVFEKESSRISLVILDLVMPQMGGKECLEEILRIDPQVKVLVTSGYSADASTRETIQMGAKGFLNKPFRVNDLLRGVRKALDEG